MRDALIANDYDLDNDFGIIYCGFQSGRLPKTLERAGISCGLISALQYEAMKFGEAKKSM